MDSKRIENAFVEVVEALGDVEYKEELKDTPKRIADSYKEIFYGIGVDPKEVLTRTFDINNNELIIEKNIDFYSMCEHHFLPFFGTIGIAYVPNKKIFGFGDIKLIIPLGGLLYQGEINIFLQIYIFYLLVFSLATLYIIIYIVISYCRNKSVKIKGVELAFAPYICLAFIIIYNFNLIEKIIERIL